MPAKSKQQFKLMKGVCNGTIKSKIPRKVACEYIKGQSPKNLLRKVNQRK